MRAMKFPPPRLAGVYLLALIGLGSSLFQASRAEPVWRARLGNDEESLDLRRFERLRRLLPAHVTVGYEADPENPLEDRQEVRRFYLTQYALAPDLVVADANREFVVANYRAPDKCRVCKSSDFVLLADLGQGLMLFRRAPR
jgi:hypothetical protein